MRRNKSERQREKLNQQYPPVVDETQFASVIEEALRVSVGNVVPIHIGRPTRIGQQEIRISERVFNRVVFKFMEHYPGIEGSRTPVGRFLGLINAFSRLPLEAEWWAVPENWTAAVHAAASLPLTLGDDGEPHFNLTVFLDAVKTVGDPAQGA